MSRRRLLTSPLTTLSHHHRHPAPRRQPRALIPLCHTRTFFGLGEIAGVLANPAETIRQLNESKELLQKAREENQLKNEAKRIPKKHTFKKLPGFHGREAEMGLIRKILEGNPQMNVVFGATSVGKTALLREVLASDEFFVIPFDLRISGFADLRTLYFTLCEQFQSLFDDMHDEEMKKLSIAFKHLMLELDEKEQNSDYKVSVADLADLMETLQSCLSKYWEYDPQAKLDEERANEEENSKKNSSDNVPTKARTLAANATAKVTGSAKKSVDTDETSNAESKGEEEPKLFQKRPIVFLMDECHKLPALINDRLSLKVFLDTLLVLSKQDRLCHVILSTSDAFFQHFLRSMNVGHHSHILTIGDCTRDETIAYIRDQVIPTVPEKLRSKVDIKAIYEAFGGKLAHISDYVSFWANTSGTVTPYESAIFTQAYTLLQFHLTHETFDTYSSLQNAPAWKSSSNDEQETKFSRNDLLHVMQQLVKPPHSLPYFDLCRKIGTHRTDAMVKTRILDLRWTRTISPEMNWVERVWSEDGVERPIVLPMTTVVRKAMEVCLKEEQEREGV